MDPRMDEPGDSLESTPPHAHDEAPLAEPSPKFDWRRFTQYLCSVMVVGLLAGLGLALWYGWRPLEKRAQAVVGPTVREVRIDWPMIPASGDSKPAAGSKGEVHPASSSFTTESRKNETAKSEPAKDKSTKGGKKGADKTAPTPPPEPIAKSTTPTTWLPEQFQEDLLEKAKKALGVKPDSLSRGPLEAVAQAMEESGWFVVKPAVELQQDGVLRVKGQWRVPAAVVRQGAKDRLISWEGMPMPVEYATGKSGLVVIQGVPDAPASRKSGGVDLMTRWPGEAFDASLELLQRLKPRAWASQVASIDASDYAKTKRLTIVTTFGNRIVWGGRASKPLWGELSSQQKLDRLDQLNRRFGQIDGKMPAIEIFGSQPLVVDQTAATAGKPKVEASKPQ